jgi:hypothetical protein
VALLLSSSLCGDVGNIVIVVAIGVIKKCRQLYFQLFIQLLVVKFHQQTAMNARHAPVNTSLLKVFHQRVTMIATDTIANMIFPGNGASVLLGDR